MDPQQTQEAQPFTPLGGSGVPVGSGAPFTPQGVNGDEQYASPGWSWGGFMFNLMFAVAIRKYVYLLLGIGYFIPFLNIFVILGTMIFFGLKGRVMAAESSTFANRDQYIGFMKGIDHAGKVMFFVYLVIFGLALGAVVFMGSLIGDALY